MEIGNQIKQRRKELHLTQEELAQKLNVARSTISNWEVGRNYPDMQLIVSISDILDIPLENLLREDSEVVKKITVDTKVRKKQSHKIKLLCVVIVLMIMTAVFGIYKTQEFKEVSHVSEITSLNVNEDNLTIMTNLPIYRSIAGYFAGDALDDPSAVEITLYSQIDLTMKNKNKLSVPLDKELFQHTDKIIITYKEKTLKTFSVNL